MINRFRVWDKDEVKYVKDASSLMLSIGDTDDGYFRLSSLCPGRYIVEQATGLKDKNGKEIYDGDLVEQFVCGIHQYKGKKCGRSTIWQVRWNEEECCFELHYVRGSLFGDSLMSIDDDYEVIGNVHKNPELLGGEE